VPEVGTFIPLVFGFHGCCMCSLLGIGALWSPWRMGLCSIYLFLMIGKALYPLRLDAISAGVFPLSWS
jgi:hypothetical protein